MIESLTTLQNVSGQNITLDTLASFLSGSSSALTPFQSAFTSGQLCTGCVQIIYQQVQKANSTIGQTSIASSLSSQCGSAFIGATSASGVSTSAVSASGSGTSSAAASSSKSAGAIVDVGLSGILVGLVGVMGVVLGGTAVLA